MSRINYNPWYIILTIINESYSDEAKAVAHSHWATWFSSERLGNPKDSLNERIEKNANFGRIEKTALISTHTAFIVP